MERSVPATTNPRIEPLGASPPTACDCCGKSTRRVWGQLSDPSSGVYGVYYVSWTEDGPEHDPAFDLVVGRWGEGATANDRVGVSLLYRASQRSFMVVDASSRAFSKNQDLFSRGLDRSEVVGTQLAAVAFAAVDAIWLHDARVEEITQW
jgi:hypothetical protein